MSLIGGRPIGVMFLTDTKGKVYGYPGQGEVVFPLATMAEQKKVLKDAATRGEGLKIGGQVFVEGMIIVKGHGHVARSRRCVDGHYYLKPRVIC